MRLSDVAGQPLAVGFLAGAIAAGKVGHAYLFYGPPGVGKRSAALAFATALNCRNPRSPGEGCGECVPCREIEKGIFPDVALVVPEGEDKRERSFHKDQIPDIIARASFTAHPDRTKVYILIDVHLMSGEAANRFLKMLEEPPPRTVWILLTTEPEAVLPTIRSRCQAVRFTLLPREALRELLRRRGREGHLEEAELCMGQLDREPEVIVEGVRKAEEFLGEASKFDLAALCRRSGEISRNPAELAGLLDGLERACAKRLVTDEARVDRWVSALDAVGRARQRLRRYAERTMVDSLGAELALILREDLRV